jgi:anti-anti-sigma factor
MSPDPTYGLLEVEQIGDCSVGRFTRRTVLEPLAVAAVGQRLRELVRGGSARKLVLNFARVESLTSAMLGEFVLLYKEIDSAGGRLVFCHVDPFLRQIFQLCQMPQQIPLYADEPTALAALQTAEGPH